MAFRVNTNVIALNAHQIGTANNREISGSLEKLSSGLRINKAADDASGMAIADSLRSQANSLGQAIKNANDGVGIIQTADKAMDEQVKILDTIKTKATQAAQDGQTEKSRKALQQDIVKLMDEIDNIAQTTSFNGQALLSGQFTDKKFQIGAYSNETITANIGATSSDKIGHTRFETSQRITATTNVALKFVDVDGVHDVQLEAVKISTSAGTGLGVLTETINKNSDQLGIKASWTVQTTGTDVVRSGSIEGLAINGIQVGNIEDIKANDKDGKLVNAINALTDKHGVIASIDERGRLELNSVDGRGIRISAQGSSNGVDTATGADSTVTLSRIGIATSGSDKGVDQNYGRLTLTRLDSRDIIISGSTLNADGTAMTAGLDNGITAAGFGHDTNGAKIESEATINLRNVKGGFTVDQASAMGVFQNDQVSTLSAAKAGEFGNTGVSGVGIGAGVTTLAGAMATMSIAEASIKDLDKIRSDLGSTQNQLVVTINNISVTQVNVKAAESQIRDVDFAEESANFQKNNILAQAGSYAMSQANQQAQAVQKFLQ
jgi:flagellin